jgi:hypothetical protein
MGRLRGNTDLSVRTVARLMAINRRVSPDIPHGGRTRPRNPAPGLPPCKASVAHAYCFIDGRIMAGAVAGTQWGSLLGLDGDARPMWAGAVAPSEARWVALMGL